MICIYIYIYILYPDLEVYWWAHGVYITRRFQTLDTLFIYIYIYTHTCIHTYVYIIYIYIYIYTHTHICIHHRTPLATFWFYKVWARKAHWIYDYMCVHMYIYIYIYHGHSQNEWCLLRGSGSALLVVWYLHPGMWLCIHIYIYISLSLSLSLYTYIYIYIHMYTRIYIFIFIHIGMWHHCNHVLPRDVMSHSFRHPSQYFDTSWRFCNSCVLVLSLLSLLSLLMLL